MKLLRWVLFSSLAVIAILIVGLVTLITLINPNDYKEQLSALVHKKTGMELTLSGDIAWQFYPAIGFAIENAALSLQADMPTLASIERAALSVDVLPLFKNQVQVNELSITGLNVDLIVDEQGHNNWALASTPSTPSTEAPQEKEQDASTPTLPDLTVPLISISHSRLSYQDKSINSTFEAQIKSLTAKDIQRSDFFPVNAEFTLIQNGYTIKNTLKARIKADDQHALYDIEELDIATTIDGVATQPLALGVTGNIAIDMAHAKINVNLSPRIANLNATLIATIENIDSQPQVSVTLNSERFNLKTLLNSLGITPPETTTDEALTEVQFNTVIKATDNTLSMQPLSIVLDNSTLTGDINVHTFNDPHINFTLALNQLTIDDYLPPSTVEATPTKESTPTPTPTSDESLLPVDALKRLKLNGTVDINRLTIQKTTLEAIHLEINAHDGLIRVNNLAVKAFDGHVSGSSELDVRKQTPKIHTNLAVDKIQVESALKTLMPEPLLSGKTSMKVDVTAYGNSTPALLRESIGDLHLQLDDGLIQGVNLNQLIIEGLQKHLGSLTALIPNIEQHLPASASKDTTLSNVVSTMHIENGVVTVPEFKASGSDGDISANGTINLIEQSFSYRFDLGLSKLQSNKYLGNIRWPIECKGLFTTPTSSWCKLDSDQVKRIVAEVAENAAKAKVANALKEKLNLGDSDEPIEEQLKQQAKDALNKKLNKVLGF